MLRCLVRSFDCSPPINEHWGPRIVMDVVFAQTYEDVVEQMKGLSKEAGPNVIFFHKNDEGDLTQVANGDIITAQQGMGIMNAYNAAAREKRNKQYPVVVSCLDADGAHRSDNVATPGYAPKDGDPVYARTIGRYPDWAEWQYTGSLMDKSPDRVYKIYDESRGNFGFYCGGKSIEIEDAGRAVERITNGEGDLSWL